MSKKVRALVAVAAVGATLTLSGCGSADVAAKVNGQPISEKTLFRVTDEINKGASVQQPLTPGQMLSWLINAPFILKVADAKGFPTTEDAARAALKNIDDPAPETLEVLRASNAIGQLQQSAPDAVTEVLNTLKTAKVVVNPRYGTYTAAANGVTETLPDWIVGGAAAK